MKANIKLVFDKSTKNTHKFVEVPVEGQAPVLEQLYIKKYAHPEPPTELFVTITNQSPVSV